MKLGTTVALCFVALGLGAFIWFEERHMPSTADFLRTRKRVFNIRSEKIDSIKVTIPGVTREVNSWTAARRSEGWVVTDPLLDYGDGAVFSTMCSRIEFTDFERRFDGVANAPFGFGETSPRVTVSAGSDMITFEIGDKDALGKGCFVKRLDSDTVYLVPASFEVVFSAPLSSVRDKTLFQASFHGASEIALEGKGLKLGFSKRDGSWTMVDPSQAFIEEGVLRRLIESLNALRIVSFDAKPVEPGEGFIKCTVLSDGGDQKGRFVAGDKNSVVLWKSEEGIWRARRRGGENSFVVKAPEGFEIPIQPEAFRLRTILPGGLRASSRLTVQSGNVTIEMQAEDGEWRMLAPVAGAANSDLVDAIFEILTTTPAATVAPANPSAIIDENLLNPVMAVMATRGATTVEVGFFSEPGAGSRLLGKRKGEADFFEAPLSILSEIPVTPEEYKVPILAEIDSNSVISIRVERTDRVEEVFRSGTGWKAMGNEGVMVNEDTVDSILLAFSRFVAGAPGPSPESESLTGRGPDLVISLGIAPGTAKGPKPELRFWNTGTRRLAYRPGDSKTYVIGDMVYELINAPLMKVSY